MAEASNGPSVSQESTSGENVQPSKEDAVASQPVQESSAAVDSAESGQDSALPSSIAATRDSAPEGAVVDDTASSHASRATSEDPTSAQDTASDSASIPAPPTTETSSQTADIEAQQLKATRPEQPVIASDDKDLQSGSGIESSIETGPVASGADKPEAQSQSPSLEPAAVNAPGKEERMSESGDQSGPATSQQNLTEQSRDPEGHASIDSDNSSSSATRTTSSTTSASTGTSSGSQLSPATAVTGGFASLFGTLTFGRAPLGQAPLGQAGKDDASAKPGPGGELDSSAKEPLVNGNASHAKPAAGRESDAAAASNASTPQASTPAAPSSSTGGFTLFRSLQTQARHLVSQNKRRYQADGFDLDLSYITENIIAMGFPAGDPSSGFLGLVEGLYRNHMDEVIAFLETHHQGKYKVFNLCSERLYDAALFQGTVACFPFDDHNCPPLHLILAFCQSALSWLRSGMDHVVVVHCKAGMGRTGIMIASLLLFLNYYSTAQEAIQYFNNKRAVDGKALVLPSQQKYVRYFEKTLKGDPRGAVPAPRKCFLRGLRLHRCPYWIRPAVVVSDHSGVLFSTKTHPKTKNLSPEDYWYPAQQRKGVMVFALPGERCVAQLQGDFKIGFLDRQGDFSCWLNTNFLPTRQLLSTKDLDHFDKRSLVSPGFIVEVVVIDNDAPLPASAKKEPGTAPGSQGVPTEAPGTTATTAGEPAAGEGSAGSAPAGASGEGTPQKAEGAAGAVGEGHTGAVPSGASTGEPQATGEPSSSGAPVAAGVPSSSSAASSAAQRAEASAKGTGPPEPGESPSGASTAGAQGEASQLSTFKQGAAPTTPSKGTVTAPSTTAGEAAGSTPPQSQSKSQAQTPSQPQPALSLFSGTAQGVSGVGSTASPSPAPASAPQATPPATAGNGPAAAQSAGQQRGLSQSGGRASSSASGSGRGEGRGRGRAPSAGPASVAGRGARVSGGSAGAGASGGQSAMGFFQAFGDALFGPSTASPTSRPGQASGVPGQGRGVTGAPGSARGSGLGASVSARKEDLETSALTSVPSRERTFSGAKAANLEGWLSPSEAAADAAKRDMDEPMLFFSDGMKFQAGPVTAQAPGSREAGATGGSSSRGGQHRSAGAVAGGVGASGGDSFDTLPVFDTPAATSSPVMGPSSDFAQAAASAADASMFTFGDEDDEVDFDGF